MSSSNCCFLTCIQISQESGQVVWYSHLLKNFPQFIVIHTVKGFGIVNKAEIDVFLELPCFIDQNFWSANSYSSHWSCSRSPAEEEGKLVGCEIGNEKPHVQGQEQWLCFAGPAMWRYPTSKGKGEAPARWRLESNPIPTRDAQRAQTNLVHIRAWGPHRDWDRIVIECLLWRYRLAMVLHRGRGSGCSWLGYSISPLGGGHH